MLFFRHQIVLLFFIKNRCFVLNSLYSQKQKQTFSKTNLLITSTELIAKKWMNRSSRLEVFCKKCVLRNFTKFTGKHLCQSLFFNKLTGLRTTTLLKKRLWHRCFPVNFAKFLRTPFLAEHLQWLLLNGEIPQFKFPINLIYRSYHRCCSLDLQLY